MAQIAIQKKITSQGIRHVSMSLLSVPETASLGYLIKKGGMKMRWEAEVIARRDLVRLSSDPVIASAYDEFEAKTRHMSPSSAFSFTRMMLRGQPYATAVAKAVRWQRILERDF